jgi:glycosyltransferase involved in cell wall biosynthesis
MGDNLYILATAARNEEAYIEKTIQSVIHQTILPKRWVIVSDGSTDRTDEIVKGYTSTYGFIQLIRIKEDHQKRNFASQVRAINTGFEALREMDYEFIGNLDADVSFEATYYEDLLERFWRNPKLGLAGGFIYEDHDGKFKRRPFNNVRSVPHAIQLFRRQCFEGVGGYIPLRYGGPDWVAEVMARRTGWQVQSFPELKVFHHRRTLGADGILRGGFRQGLMDYSVGSHPIFEALKCISRIKGRPYFLYALCRMVGFVWASCQREKRMVADEFVKYLRREQVGRLKSLFVKKSKCSDSE